MKSIFIDIISDTQDKWALVDLKKEVGAGLQVAAVFRKKI